MMMNYFANFLTILSLFFGFISIIFSLVGQFTFAAWSIILSVIFDGLDGQVARLNPVSSELGKQLDSLADVVSFGVAPSVLGYVFIYKQFHSWAVIVLFIYLLCSVWRLAKYNITPKEELLNCFIGLPTTVSGAVLASFILIYRKQEDMLLPEFVPDILSPQFTPVIFLVLVLVLAFLMVSRIRYLNLDGFKQLFGNKTRLAVSIIFILLIPGAFLKKLGTTLFIFCSIYLLFSPVVVKRLKPR
jgi:CDP-diacylglycerol--serine O-phosphatidyltransferase